MNPRFSVRFLLIVTALLASFCWRRDRPRQLAIEFAAALDARDWKGVNATFAEGHRDELFTANPYGLFDESKFETKILPQSAKQWLRGESIVTVRHRDSRLRTDTQITLASTATGLKYRDYTATMFEGDGARTVRSAWK